MNQDNKDDFYDHYNLVNDEDIEKAKKNKNKKPIKMSSSKKRSTYEKVSTNKEINKEEILKDEPVIEKQEEEFLVHYEMIEEKKEEPTKTPIYIGYTPRLVISIILVPILSILSIYLLYHAFTVDDLVNIRYTELGTITPKEIGNNQLELDVDYQFQVNQNSNLSIKYLVTEELFIVDKVKEDKIYYQESFPLNLDKEETIKEETNSNYREVITLDYKEQEERVKKYKESYDVETFNYIKINLQVNYQSLFRNNYYLSDGNSMSIIIPILTPEKEIEINNLDTEKRVNKKPTVRVANAGFLGLGVLVGIGAVLALTQAIILVYSTMNQKSLYDRTVDKILRKNKKRIQEVSKVPRKTGKKTTTANSIKELVKVSKKLKVPIKYCVINEHNKCQFFIEYNKELYIYIIKAIDLEKKD